MASLVLAATVSARAPREDWAEHVQLANRLVESGRLDEAHALYSSALASAQTAGDHVRASLVLQNMGRLFDRAGQLRDAERAYLQAAHALDKAGVNDHRLIVRASLGLVPVYMQTGQYSKAETLIRRLLTDYPGATDADRASLMGSLGVTLAHRRQFAEAAQVLRATAHLCAANANPEIREVGAIAIANLAGLQMREGRLPDAMDSYRHALAIIEAVPAPYPAALAVTLMDYAKALRTAGDVAQAETLYRKAIAIAETRLGPTNLILARLLEQYAAVVRDGGRRSEARKLVDAARQIRREWDRANMTGHTVEVESLRAGR